MLDLVAHFDNFLVNIELEEGEELPESSDLDAMLQALVFLQENFPGLDRLPFLSTWFGEVRADWDFGDLKIHFMILAGKGPRLIKGRVSGPVGNYLTLISTKPHVTLAEELYRAMHP